MKENSGGNPLALDISKRRSILYYTTTMSLDLVFIYASSHYTLSWSQINTLNVQI